MRTRDEIEADPGATIVRYSRGRPITAAEQAWDEGTSVEVVLATALGVAEAALVEQMPNAKAPNTGAWYDAGEWVAVEVDACTCGTPKLTYGHEAGCGLEPAFKCATVEDALIAVREHNEVLGRAEVAEAALARVIAVCDRASGDHIAGVTVVRVPLIRQAAAALVPTPEPPAKPETRYGGHLTPMRDPYAPVSGQPNERPGQPGENDGDRAGLAGRERYGSPSSPLVSEQPNQGAPE